MILIRCVTSLWVVVYVTCVLTCSYTYEDERGVFPELSYILDLSLPPHFVPKNSDGEVESFQLVPMKDVSWTCFPVVLSVKLRVKLLYVLPEIQLQICTCMLGNFAAIRRVLRKFN